MNGFKAQHLIMFLTVIFIILSVWIITEQNADIKEITLKSDAWESRAKDLDAYVVEKEKQFRVATKFDNFFMMIADPDQVIDMEALDGYIESRKQFFEVQK